MKITLVEFDIGTEWNRYQITPETTEVLWVNYAPGVWVTSVDGDFSYFDSDLVGAEFTWYSDVATTEDVSGYVTRVGSVFVDTERAPSTVDLATLLSLEEWGFYWDDVERLLYLRLPFSNSPDLYSIIVGLAELISDKEYVDEINDRIYDPELISIPSVSKTIDPLFFGRIQYNDVNLQLHNLHGRYDDIGRFDVYGGEVRILYGSDSDDYTDFKRIWTGYIDDFTVTEGECSIRASDSRKLLERPVPVSFFSQTDFPNLSDRDDGKPIPIHYGKVIGFTPICIDTEADHTTADYNFKLCDTSLHDGIVSVDEVRYKGEVVSSTNNLTTAIITLAYADIQDSNGRVDFRDIEVDFHGVQEGGTGIENGLDVVSDMIDKYGGIPFSNTRYDESTWNTIKATMPDIGLSIEKDSTIAQQIEKIAASLRIQFDVQGDGRYTARAFNQSAEPDTTINEDQLLSPIEAVYTSDEFATRLYVNYVGGVLRYTENEQAIIDRYKTTRPAEFDTVLTSAVDAQDFAEDVISLVADFPPLINVTIPIDDDFEIEDNVYAILNRLSGRWFGRMKCRVEGVQYNFDDETVTLSLRAFESMADIVVPVYQTDVLLDTSDLEILDTDDRNILTIIEV